MQRSKSKTRKAAKYSSKRSKSSKPISTKYKVKPYRKYTGYRSQYRRPIPPPWNPVVALSRHRNGYIKHISQVDAGPLTVPNGVSITSSDQLQAMQYRQFNLQTWSPLDQAVQNYMTLYQEFRMSYVWVELTPKWNVTSSVVNLQSGEIIIVPLHNQEEIYRSGQTNVGFGGTFPAMTELDVDHWMQIPGARRFSFTKPGTVARIRIPLTTFEYAVDNARIGDGLVGSGSTIRARKAPWLNVMDAESLSTATSNTTRHYGFMIGFYGWNTGAANSEFAFKFKQYLQIEFKRQNVFLLSSLGAEEKKHYPSEDDDHSTLHVEEPWEEDDEKLSQVSTAAVKRQLTNMHLDAAQTLSSMGPPVPKAPRTTSLTVKPRN